MGRTQAYVTVAYAQSSHGQCDLDIQADNMVLAHDLSSCHNDNLCQTILQSHHTGYGIDRILGTHTLTGAALYALLPFHGGGIKSPYSYHLKKCTLQDCLQLAY